MCDKTGLTIVFFWHYMQYLVAKHLIESLLQIVFFENGSCYFFFIYISSFLVFIELMFCFFNMM